MTTTINAKSTGIGGLDVTCDASGALGLQTGGTTAVTINTTQYVGINNTSPASSLDVTGHSASNGYYNFKGYSAGRGYGSYTNSSGTIVGYIGNGGGGSMNTGAVTDFGISSAGNLLFSAGGSLNEQMRIDSSGNVGIGNSSPTYKLDIISGNSNSLKITTNNTNTTIINLTRTDVSTVTHTIDNTGYKLINGGSGGVYLGYTGTSWTSLSDERFKTDLKPIENAVEKVSTLRAVTGRFKTDNENKSRSFLIAQDIQAVLPEAVDTSDPEQLGVSYTDTIPLLVAAIKEQTQIINDLKARIETLESK